MGQMNRRKIVAAALLSSFEAVRAQDSWPARPVRMVVAFAPGGTVDLVTRHIADRISPLLGQPVIVENRPGAGGNLATEQIMRQPADGYTFVVGGSPTHAVNPHLFKLAYDPIADMSLVALLGTAPNLLVANPALGLRNVEDLVKLARVKPGQLSFSSAGNGTSGHLAGELFARIAGIQLQHVPYKGQADALTGVMRGDVAMAFVTLAGTLQMVQAGRLTALATTGKDRTILAPEIPTVTESGYSDFDVKAWYSIAGPKGIPASIVGRLSRAIERVMKEPQTAERLKTLGAEPTFLTESALTAFMRSDSARWARVIREAGIQPN